MAEQGGTRPDIDLIRWASVDQSEVADPGSGLKDAGYPDSAIPANEHHNALFHENYNRHVWAEAVMPRQFEYLAEALDVSDLITKNMFRVGGFEPGADTLSRIGALVASPVVGTITGVATDGQRVFYSVSDDLTAVAGWGGAASGWTVKPSSGNAVIALSADGAFVYVATADLNIHIVIPSTGSVNQSLGVQPDTIADLAANGSRLVAGLAGASDLAKVWLRDVSDVFNPVGSTPTHGANIRSVAVDRDQGYLCGVGDAFGVNVRAFSLVSPGSFSWSTKLPGVVSAEKVEADGDYVYVATTVGDFGKNLFCLRRTDGQIVWSAVIPDGDLFGLAIDDRFCWVSGVTDDAFAAEKSNGQIVWGDGSTFIPFVGDGFVVVGTNGSTQLQTRRKGDVSTTYVRVDGGDVYRRPFYRLAIPVNGDPKGAQRQNPFGQDFFWATSAVLVQNAAAPFVQFMSLAFTITEPGDYFITWSYVWRHSATNSDFWARTQLDNTTDLLIAHFERPNNAGVNQRFHSSGAKTMTLATGAHTVDIDLSAPTGGTAEIYEGTIHVWRVQD